MIIPDSIEVVPLFASYLILERESVGALDDRLRHTALSYARDRVWWFLTPVERSILVTRKQPVYPR